VRGADNLTAIREPIVNEVWEPRRLTILCVSTHVTGIALPLGATESRRIFEEVH
jgi:hypothetical protein